LILTLNLSFRRQLDEQLSQRMAVKESEKIIKVQELQQVQQDVDKYLAEEKAKKVCQCFRVIFLLCGHICCSPFLPHSV
jgi:hypothetical protein